MTSFTLICLFIHSETPFLLSSLFFPVNSCLICILLFVGYGKKAKHMRSKTWNAGNGRVSPPSPPGTNGKKLASYAPKKDRESFRRALVSIIR